MAAQSPSVPDTFQLGFYSMQASNVDRIDFKADLPRKLVWFNLFVVEELTMNKLCNATIR